MENRAQPQRVDVSHAPVPDGTEPDGTEPDGPGPDGTADPPSVSEQIRQRLGMLSPSERRVARTLLAGPPTIGLESSARLAQHAGVSVPTVSRFIAGLGFGSYADFQRTLHAEISARIMSPAEVYRLHQTGQRSSDLLSASARILGESVTASVAGLDPDEFHGAAGLLANSTRQVLVTGGWFSQLLAGYLASVLREIRPGVRLVGPSSSERAGAVADMAKRDVIAAFDFRRYDRDTLEFARSARGAGARIVLITDPWLSPVADIADAVLTAQVAGPSPFASLTPALAVVETLVAAAVDVLGEAGRARFEHFGEIAEHWVHPWPGGADWKR